MLPRNLRLSRQGFDGMRGARTARSPHFSLSYKELAEHAGIAVVVPKKSVRSAVRRHLMKRRLLHLLRPYAGTARALIVSVRPGAADVPFPGLKDELISLIRTILPEH